MCVAKFHVLSVSVESDMECQLRVDDVFGAVSLSGTLRSLKICSKKAPFGGNASLFCLLTQALPIFSNISRLPVTHAGQKSPQFCGIGRSSMLDELHCELVP